MKKFVMDALNGLEVRMGDVVIEGRDYEEGDVIELAVEDGGWKDVIFTLHHKGEKIFEERLTVDANFLEQVSETLNTRGYEEVDEAVVKTLAHIELGNELVRVFGSWIGTPSEELLEDGGTVIDHLCTVGNRYERDKLEALPQETWERAWEYFDREVGRVN